MWRLLVLSGMLAVSACWGLEIETYAGDKGNEVLVDNGVFRVVVAPGLGGRIKSLVDLKTGKELVFYADGAGGLLDDRDNFSSTVYSLRTAPNNDKTAVEIIMTGTAYGGFSITKRLIIKDNSPLLRTIYLFANGSQQDRAPMIRNFLRPNGDDHGPDTVYTLHTKDGLVADPDMKGRFTDLPATWFAMIHQPTRRGVLMTTQLSPLNMIYFWRGSAVSPTAELGYKPIPAGQQLQVEVNLALLQDVDAVDDALVLKTVPGRLWMLPDAPVMSAVPGWKDLRLQIEPTAAQQARGFVLYRGYGDDPAAEVTSLRFDSPLQGGDSCALQVTAVRDVKLTVISTCPGVSAYFEDDFRLKPLGTLDMKAGDVRALQVAFDAPAAGGTATGALSLDAGAGPLTVAVEAKAWALRIPPQRLLYHNLYGGALYMFSHGMDFSKPENLEDLKLYCEDSGRIGATVCQFVTNFDLALPHLLIKATGEPVLQAAKRDPALFAGENWPDADLSYFNPWVDEAFANGYREAQIFLNNGDFRTGALAQAIAGKKLTPEDPLHQKVYEWYMGQWSKYLQSRGFPCVYAKIMDEISPDDLPQYLDTARIGHRLGFRCYTTVTGGIPRSAELINTMNPLAEGWQLQLMSTKIFRTLTTQKFVVEEKQAPLTSAWGPYGNGGAKNTYGASPFGTALQDKADEVEAFEVLLNGQPLRHKGGSPWGNTETGVYFLQGPTLYVSLPDGSDPRQLAQPLVARYRVRQADDRGEVMAKVDPTDVITYYGGGSKPYQIPYGSARRYGFFAGAQDYAGYGFWAYAHGWHATERVLFKEEGTVYRTPCWFGLRDGNVDGNLIAQLRAYVRACRASKAVAANAPALVQAEQLLAKLMGSDDQALIKLETGLYSGYEYDFPAVDDNLPRWAGVRVQLLEALAGLEKLAGPALEPVVQWGDDVWIAAASANPDLQIIGGGAEAAALKSRFAAKLDALRPLAKAMSNRPEPVLLFIGLPSAEVLRQHKLDPVEVGCNDRYPGASDYLIYRQKSGQQVRPVIVAGDMAGAEKAITALLAVTQPVW